MIHDAKIEVTCDGKGCTSSELYDMPYVYRTMSESSGYYDYDEDDIADWLRDECDWIVRDDKHYCCEECAEASHD